MPKCVRAHISIWTGGVEVVVEVDWLKWEGKKLVLYAERLNGESSSE